jgi:hypothetical protein
LVTAIRRACVQRGMPKSGCAAIAMPSRSTALTLPFLNLIAATRGLAPRYSYSQVVNEPQLVQTR